mmetsp:Transcript_22344/g.22528  ORF Transcript_22344/g.22528 Transcript_22344/m.22528 type:complete len:419 (+) Transcript_22344:217-1473(+)
MISSLSIAIFLLFISSCHSFRVISSIAGFRNVIKSGVVSYVVTTLPSLRLRSPLAIIDGLGGLGQRLFFGQSGVRSVAETGQGLLSQTDNVQSSSISNVTTSFFSQLFTINKEKEETKLLTASEYENSNQVLTGRLLAWFLKSLIEPRTKSISGLKIDVYSAANRDIIRGKVDRCILKFDTIAYSMIQISGGGTLEVTGVELKMRRLLFQDLHFLRKPYNIRADFVFLEADIVNSQIFRSWIQSLVDIIITQALSDPARGVIPNVTIKRATIRSKRFYIHGEAAVGKTRATIPFEMSASFAVRNKQIVYVQNIQVVLNPDTFLRTSVPILLSSPIDVDLGDDIIIDEFAITGNSIEVKARSVVYPVEPFAVTPLVKRALYRYDLTAVLSQALRFKGGFLRMILPSFRINLNIFRRKKQ